MRKIISLLIILSLVFCAAACTGSSSGSGNGGYHSSVNVTSAPKSEESVFEAYNGGYKLVACGEKYKNDTAFTIPAQYEDADVVAIGNGAFSGFSSLVSVTIPDTVTEIDKRAFENCSSLDNVVMTVARHWLVLPCLTV